MHYPKLKKSCIEKTDILIKNHDWIKIQRIVKDSPKQLIELSNLIEETIVKENINIKKESIFINRTQKNHLKRSILVSLELFKIQKTSFNENYKKNHCEKIFPISEKIDENHAEDNYPNNYPNH